MLNQTILNMLMVSWNGKVLNQLGESEEYNVSK